MLPHTRGSIRSDLARSLREVVAAEAAASERQRTLSQPIVDAMWASGLMSSFNPAAAGGTEPSFAEMIETWIEMAWQDGSFGWIGIANLPSSFAAAAYLPDAGFDEVFTAQRQPRDHGRSVRPERPGHQRSTAGYRLTGRGTSAPAPATRRMWQPASCRWTTASCAWISRGHPRTAWSRSCPATRSPSPTAGTSRD